MVVGSFRSLHKSLELCTERIRDTTKKESYFISFCFYSIIKLFTFHPASGQMSSSLLFFFPLLWDLCYSVYLEKMRGKWKVFFFLLIWLELLQSTSGFLQHFKGKMRKHGWQLPYHPLQVLSSYFNWSFFGRFFILEVKVWDFVHSLGRWWLLLCSWHLGLLSTSSLLLLLGTRFISTLWWAFTLLW